ncbi:hypothetical protein ACLH3T_002476 [Flavobacterium psychrophilum]
MNTAMQDVIVKLQEAKENFPNIGFDDEFIRGFNKAFQMAIFIVEKVGLEKELQQNEKVAIDMVKIAIDRGGKEGVSMEHEFNNYYQLTFNRKVV